MSKLPGTVLQKETMMPEEPISSLCMGMKMAEVDVEDRNEWVTSAFGYGVFS